MKKDVQQILSELINIPTYEGIDVNHPIIQYLEDSFSSCVQIIKLQDVMNNTHMLIGVNTELRDISNAFVFSGHIDTVPESAHHQAKAVLRNGHIEGLGGADMKGFVASLIDNIDNLKGINIPIVISLTSDEETDFYGIESVVSEMKERNINPKAVIIGEPTSSKIALSHRGNSIFVSQVEGKSCHSSTPELGINAINLSMEAVSKIEECILKYKGNASICITKIEGGKACNVVPDLCKTTISVRTSNHKCLQAISDDFKKIYEQIAEKAISAKIDNVFNIPAFENKNDRMLNLFASKEIINFSGASEAGFIQQAFNDVDIAIYGPGDQKCIHKEGEKISVEELSRYSTSLPNVVTRYFNLQKENIDNHDLQF